MPWDQILYGFGAVLGASLCTFSASTCVWAWIYWVPLHGKVAATGIVVTCYVLESGWGWL